MSFGWAIAGIAGLALLLVLACQPGYAMAAPAGMSAPLAPATAIESGPAAQLLPSQSHTHGLALRALSFSFAMVAFCAPHDARQDAEPDAPHYGPLHRRPPPSFS
jgi:hypothetical protein